MDFGKCSNEGNSPLSASQTRHGNHFRSLLIALCFVFLSAFAAQAQTNNPVPRLVQPLKPTTAVPGSATLTLTVNGTGFVSSSVVNWNRVPLATVFVSSDVLTATVPSSDLLTASTATVTVSSPAPGGGTSNAIYFPIAKKLVSLGFSSSSMSTGTLGNPVAVSVGDFKNNGIIDFAVANDMDHAVWVYLGNGDGTFQAPVTYSLIVAGHPHPYPLNLMIGDFNNDGKLDIVTVNAHDNSICILLGNGDGTFQTTPLYAAVGGNPQSLNIGDFNGDGNLDVVTTNFATNNVSVLLGIGNGTFMHHVDYAVGMKPLDVTVGDFTGKGMPDLAVANNGDSTISILIGNGDGTFTQPNPAYPTGSTPNGITAADFNGNGILDLATTDASSQFSILLGNGDGTFQAPLNTTTASYPAYTMTAYDMNSSGVLDLLFGIFNQAEIAVYFGNGDGTFKAGPSTFPSPIQPVSLAVADFNNDGRLDVVSADEAANMVTLFIQNNSLQPTLTPPSLAFGNQQIGLNGGTMTTTLKNIGNTTLTNIVITLVGVNMSEFSVSNTTCSTSLTAGQTCTISVTFLPITEGLKSASVSVVSSAGTVLGPLSGSGVQSLTISKDLLIFPLTVVGQTSAPQTVTITNKSGEVLTVSSITITGHNINSFAETDTCRPSIPPLGNCTMTTTFTPVQSGGLEATTIIMSSSSTPKRGVQLQGTATSVLLSPNTLNFGKVRVGTSSAPMIVTLTNEGPLPITFTNITFTGVTDYTQTNTCPTGTNGIAVGGTCTISVVFTPQGTGTRAATMDVNDTGGESPQTVPLTGIGQ